jgi:hypothetical protein
MLAFEELYGALVLFGLFPGAKRAEVPTLASLGINLAGIEPILA